MFVKAASSCIEGRRWPCPVPGPRGVPRPCSTEDLSVLPEVLGKIKVLWLVDLADRRVSQPPVTSVPLNKRPSGFFMAIQTGVPRNAFRWPNTDQTNKEALYHGSCVSGRPCTMSSHSIIIDRYYHCWHYVLAGNRRQFTLIYLAYYFKCVCP